MRILLKALVIITLGAGSVMAQCSAGIAVPNPFGTVPRLLCTAGPPASAATNGAVFWNGSAFVSTPTGGAGTLCLTSASGGTPTWGSCSGSSSTVWSSLTAPSGNLSLAMAANTSTFTWGAATGSGTNMFTVTDTASNTGTGFAFVVNLASGSAAKPVEFAVNGNGVSVSNAGVFAPLGTGHNSADQVNGTTVSGTQNDVVVFGASNILSDSAVLIGNIPTAASNYTSGDLIQAAGNNKTQSDSGIATSTVATLTGTQTLTNKTLTSPKITTITDANGNPFILSSATASAVDSLTVTNAATANPATVAIGATGSDSNINLNLTPKGTGTVQIGGSPAVSAAGTLTSNLPIIGNGAASINVGTVSGNTTEFVTTTGTQTSTALVKIDASGNHIPSGATIDSSNNISTPGSVTSGAGSGNTGYWQLNGSSSGSAGMAVANVAGTQAFLIFPNPGGGTNGQFLQLGASSTCPTNVPGTCYSGVWASPSGSGTVGAASANQVAVYSASTTVGGLANLTYSAGVLSVGSAGTQGELDLQGTTSGTTKIVVPGSGGGTWTVQSGSDTVVGRATTDTLTNKTINCANNTCTVRAADISTANPIITTTVGTSRTISNALGEVIICTGTCTVTPPATGSTVAGMQFCVQDDDNISTVITIAAVASVQYETQARTSYKAANTAIASGGAVKDQACYVARDATHWNMFSSTGTWN